MAKLILAEGNSFLSEHYVALPAPNGVVVHMRTDEFLNELVGMSESDQVATLEWMVPANAQYLGIDPVTITAAVSTALQYGKQALDWIKQNNPFKNDPPLQAGYQYPGLDEVKRQIAAGYYTYKQGALLLGPNHPLTKPGTPGSGRPTGHSFPVGTFYANLPDEAIAALDQDYQKQIVNVVKPGTTPAQVNVTKPAPTAPPVPGDKKNLNISYTTREWYESPWLWGGIGAAALVTVLLLSRRS